MLKTGPVDLLELCARREDYHRHRISIDYGNGSENVTFKMNSRFFKLCRVFFQFVENGKCRPISLESIS